MARVISARPMWGWLSAIWTITWKSIAFLLLWAVLYAPLIVPTTGIMEYAVGVLKIPPRIYFDLCGAVTILIAAWVMVRLVDRRPFVSLGWAPRHFLRDSARGVVIGVLWLGTSLAALWLLGYAAPQTGYAPDFTLLFVPGIALVLNTVIQEVLARSYIFQTIQFNSSARWAILVTSLLFMLYHSAGLRDMPLAALNLFCAGVLFGVAYYVTGNLWLPIAIHFTWNFLLGPVLGLSVSGTALAEHEPAVAVRGAALYTGGAFGIEASVVVTATTLAGIALLWWWYRKRPDSFR